jgi:hypothetical protein
MKVNIKTATVRSSNATRMSPKTREWGDGVIDDAGWEWSGIITIMQEIPARKNSGARRRGEAAAGEVEAWS